MSNKNIDKEVLTMIENVRPYLREMICAQKRYESNPCVSTGAYRQDAYVRLCEIMMSSMASLGKMWFDCYRELMTWEEMLETVRTALDKSKFSDEEERMYWKKVIPDGGR